MAFGKLKGAQPEDEIDLTQLDTLEELDKRLNEAREELQRPITNWDEVYIRIKLSPLGGDFNPQVFLATPVRIISWLLDQLNLHECRQQNAASISTAYLNHQLLWAIYGQGGGKGPKPTAKVKDFLPYPQTLSDSSKGPQGRGANVSEASRITLKRLLSAGLLPYDIFITLWRGPNQ